MKNRKKDFIKALGIAIGFTSLIFKILGTIVYIAFAQYT